MTEQTTHSRTDYRPPNGIHLHKAQLHANLTKDSNKIAGLWNELMREPKDKSTSTQRFLGVFNVGVGILDGLILTWKLYHMLGDKQSSSLFNNELSLFEKKKK